RLNSETPIAKAVGVLFWAVEKAHVQTSRNSAATHLNYPSVNSIQSVSSYLVWCSSFSQGPTFLPQDAASPLFNEML
ncbi:hypothetical protein, partial [Pseudomonas shahriarae]|uniref:hypothetical protein n=1 Tax=Pseudomonas shahriarae TaxID=2745512 RepID=UPI00249C21FE